MARRTPYAADHTFRRFPTHPIFWLFSRIVMKVGPLRRIAVNLFANIFYDSAKATWDNMSWLGVSCQKYPTDLWVYQEIISQKRPEVIIETGTLYGGSALYFASLFDMIGRGRVISIDLQVRTDRPTHPRITYISGSSTSPEAIAQLEPLIAGCASCMVILDSDHRQPHVDEELRIYSRYVTPGQYLIVEDSAIGGHPISAQFGPGPFDSLQLFLRNNRNFVADKTQEKFLLTANPNGYLLRLE